MSTELLVLGGVLFVGGAVAAARQVLTRPSNTKTEHPAVVSANGPDATPGSVIEAGPGGNQHTV